LDPAHHESPQKMDRFFSEYGKLIKSLDSIGVKVADVSGDADCMIKEIARNDVHVGYRVHSHICALSMGMPSILIAEDTRGTSLSSFLGRGGILAVDGGLQARPRLLKRLRSNSSQMNKYIVQDVLSVLEYETDIFPAIRSHAKALIAEYSLAQQSFLNGLP